MWGYVLVTVGSVSAGTLWGVWVAHAVFGRLIKRLDSRDGRLQALADMENRRVAYDSGRDTLARSDAGRTAVVHDGMGSKPGTLAAYLRDSALTKNFDAERG